MMMDIGSRDACKKSYIKNWTKKVASETRQRKLYQKLDKESCIRNWTKKVVSKSGQRMYQKVDKEITKWTKTAARYQKLDKESFIRNWTNKECFIRNWTQKAVSETRQMNLHWKMDKDSCIRNWTKTAVSKTGQRQLYQKLDKESCVRNWTKKVISENGQRKLYQKLDKESGIRNWTISRGHVHLHIAMLAYQQQPSLTFEIWKGNSQEPVFISFLGPENYNQFWQLTLRIMRDTQCGTNKTWNWKNQKRLACYEYSVLTKIGNKGRKCFGPIKLFVFRVPASWKPLWLLPSNDNCDCEKSLAI